METRLQELRNFETEIRNEVKALKESVELYQQDVVHLQDDIRENKLTMTRVDHSLNEIKLLLTQSQEKEKSVRTGTAEEGLETLTPQACFQASSSGLGRGVSHPPIQTTPAAPPLQFQPNFGTYNAGESLLGSAPPGFTPVRNPPPVTPFMVASHTAQQPFVQNPWLISILSPLAKLFKLPELRKLTSTCS